ncbi:MULTISPECIES: hypothetical protein [Fusobacterium]|jgi:hypothetical protein|uniref:hypothetical protein n=1 Tax=Fusobacterium TaxID=848 RepID=UPI000E9226B8|nr:MULTISPECIES: hypothetical protein [Fusobacterium]DAE77851.1 MAG TPA: hypothetical protein [Caudoviricetes sp.]HBJ79734.1 hypothetical protein [Fusobacterium sp.]
MDKVILLKRHLKSFVYLENIEGKYIDGIWIDGIEKEILFKAAPFPVDANTLKLYPEGTIRRDDLLLYTKKELNNLEGKVKRIVDGKIYKIFDEVSYLEMADLKVYLVKSVDEDGEN